MEVWERSGVRELLDKWGREAQMRKDFAKKPALVEQKIAELEQKQRGETLRACCMHSLCSGV